MSIEYKITKTGINITIPNTVISKFLNDNWGDEIEISNVEDLYDGIIEHFKNDSGEQWNHASNIEHLLHNAIERSYYKFLNNKV